MSIIFKLLSPSFWRRQPAIRKRSNKNHLGNSNQLRVPGLKLLIPFTSEIAFLFVSFLPFLEPIPIPSKKFYSGLDFKFQKTKVELPEYYAQILLALPLAQINTSTAVLGEVRKQLQGRQNLSQHRLRGWLSSSRTLIILTCESCKADRTRQRGGWGERGVKLTDPWLSSASSCPQLLQFGNLSNLALEIPMGLMEFLNSYKWEEILQA